jgi:hypothetical protein
MRSKSLVFIIFPATLINCLVKVGKSLAQLTLAMAFAIYEVSHINPFRNAIYPATPACDITFVMMPSLKELYGSFKNLNALSKDLSRVILPHLSII